MPPMGSNYPATYQTAADPRQERAERARAIAGDRAEYESLVAEIVRWAKSGPGAFGWMSDMLAATILDRAGRGARVTDILRDTDS
jgi:hypothetical protein